MNYYRIAVLLIAVIFLTACNDQNVKALRDHGQEVIGHVSSKEKSSRQRSLRNSGAMTLTVMYFAKDSAALAADKEQDKMLKDSTVNMLERLEKWNPGGSGIGKLITADVSVDVKIYDKYKVGDNVKLKYLPEKPEVVMLVEQID